MPHNNFGVVIPWDGAVRGMRTSPLMRLSFFVGIAAVAGVVGMGVHASSRGQTRLGPFKGDALNPEQYRASIVAIDAVLLEDGPLSESGRTQAGDALLALGRLTAVDTSNTIAVTLAENARMLSSMVQHTEVGTPILNTRLRREWMRIRGSMFADASWFRQSSADPVATTVAGPPPPSNVHPATAEARSNLETVLYSLGLLIESGRRDLPNPGDSDIHRVYVSDTERELAAAAARLGPPPPAMVSVDVYYLRARDYTEGTMRALRSAAMIEPGNPKREEWLSEADTQLAKAKQAMEKMLR